LLLLQVVEVHLRAYQGQQDEEGTYNEDHDDEHLDFGSCQKLHFREVKELQQYVETILDRFAFFPERGYPDVAGA